MAVAHKYFVYSSDNGFSLFATAAEAKAMAEELIAEYREDAYDDGWSEDVESVCWGVVSQHAVSVSFGLHPDPASGSYSCDYALKSV